MKKKGNSIFDEKFNFNFSVYRTLPVFLDPVRVNLFTLFGISVKQARRIAKEISSTDGYYCVIDRFV